MREELLNKILKRLDVLIGLQLKEFSWDRASDQDRIEKLDQFGLKPSEIADILSTTGDRVSKQLYAIKRKGEKNGKQK